MNNNLSHDNAICIAPETPQTMNRIILVSTEDAAHIVSIYNDAVNIVEMQKQVEVAVMLLYKYLYFFLVYNK